MDSSPFSTLPKELRLLVYSFVFTQSGPITIALKFRYHEKRGTYVRLARSKDVYHPSMTATQAETISPPMPAHPVKLLALTKTCRQIREESLPIMLENNAFQFCNAVPMHNTHPNHIGAVMAEVEKWLGRVGPSWPTSLREVEFDTNVCWLGDVEHNVLRIMEVLKAVKRAFRECKALKLVILVRVSWNVYRPIYGDVGPFLLRLDGRDMQSMFEQLDFDLDRKEGGLKGHGVAISRSKGQLRECQEKLKGILEMLDDDPGWDWS